MKYLGIDAGQSHLEAVLLDDGRLLGQGTGGPSHRQGHPMDEVFACAVTRALEALPDPGAIDAIGVGLTGAGIPGKRESVNAVIHRLFPNIPLFMDNDAVIGHYGATEGGEGASILAGTGSIAYGTRRGERLRLGGFGYLFGDEGGGIWIGLEAIRRGMKAAEGRAHSTSITEAAQSYFRISDLVELRGLFYAESGIDIAKLAGFAKPVLAEAERGDEIATAIAVDAGRQLAELACHTMDQLRISANEAFPLYRMGGVWRGGATICRSFEEAVSAKYPRTLFSSPKRGAAEGAALYAMEMLKEKDH